jgi:phosphopantothenoylcysteine decarboxylase/phosphopantothenate--cysteine ligase
LAPTGLFSQAVDVKDWSSIMGWEWLWEYHPSRGIIGAYGGDLTGKCIALGVTGSIALYRSIDLARLLMRYGARVRVVMTPTAARMVSPQVFAWATASPVITEMTSLVEHVTLAEACDAVVVAPATLESMSNIAEYRASNAVTALVQEAAGLGKPILIVPAMHGGMWRRASQLAEKLERQGMYVMRPILESGQAKYPPIELIAWWIEAIVNRGLDLKGYTVLVTAGPTREHIDPVRIITNPSTGRMGVSIALEAAWRGAKVTLIHGPLSTCLPRGWQAYIDRVIAVETADEMAKAVSREINKAMIAFYAAAVSDYKPVKRVEEKISSTQTGKLIIELEATTKTIEIGVSKSPSTIHFGFAAETASTVEELIHKAKRKLEHYKLDAIAANNILEPGAGFAAETNHVYVATWYGDITEIPKMSKRLVARRLLDIARRLASKGPRPR